VVNLCRWLKLVQSIDEEAETMLSGAKFTTNKTRKSYFHIIVRNFKSDRDLPRLLDYFGSNIGQDMSYQVRI
jgi:hypothetical protein